MFPPRSRPLDVETRRSPAAAPSVREGSIRATRDNLRDQALRQSGDVGSYVHPACFDAVLATGLQTLLAEPRWRICASIVNLTLRFDAMAMAMNMLPSVALRFKAGQLLSGGKSPTEVADALGISVQTARRYRTLLSEGGLDALKRMSVGGRKPSHSPEAREWIATALRGPASAHGYPSVQWTDGRLRSLIARELGIYFSRVHVRQLIIDLGFADCLIHKSSRGPHVSPSSQVSTASLTSWVAAALRHSPKAQGIEADSWTNERLRKAIECHFGIRYSRGHVWKIATDLELSHLIRKTRR